MDCNKPKLSKVRTTVGGWGLFATDIVFSEHVAVPTSDQVIIFKNVLIVLPSICLISLLQTL